MVALLEQHRYLCVKQGFWHHGVITLGHGHIDELPLVASTEFVADALDSVFDGAGRAPQHASDILGRSATKQEEQHQHLQVSEKINRSLQIGCGSKEVLRLVD